MKFATISTLRHTSQPALVVEDRVHTLPFPDMYEVMEVGAEKAAKKASKDWLSVDEVKFLSPLKPFTLRDGYAFEQHEVGRDEFRWFMEQERGAVFHYFKTKYGLESNQGFWGHQIGGTTPKAMLQSNSVARITREKVEQMLFQEAGLVKDIRYAAFLAQLERLNEEREQAARQGRAVYGPVRYTQLQFYQHWKATLRAQAKEKLAEKQWAPREEELRKFHDKNRAWFRASPSSSIEVVMVQAPVPSSTTPPLTTSSNSPAIAALRR